MWSRLMPPVQCRKHQNADYLSAFDITNTRDGRSLQPSTSYVHRNLIYVNNNSVFINETSTDNLERRFHQFIKSTKPRQTLNYFIGEIQRLNVTDDHTK